MKWSDHRLWLVFFAAIVVRVAYYWQHRASPLAGYYVVDHHLYAEWATRIARGDWWGEGVFQQGPLYAYLLGIFFRLCGPADQAVVLLQLLSGVVMSVLVFLCGRRLFDDKTALIAGLLTAVYGPLMFYECQLMKTFLSPLLTTIALYCGLRFGETGRRCWLISAGAAIGLACLERESHVLLLIPLIVCTIWRKRPVATQPKQETASQSSATSLLRRVAPALWPIAACGLMLAPSAVRNYVVAKEVVLVTSGGGEVFYMAYAPESLGYYFCPKFVRPSPFLEHDDFRAEASRRAKQPLSAGESSRFWFREALSLAITSPLRTIELAVRKTVILFNDFEVPDSEDYTVSTEFVPLLRFLPSFGWVIGFGAIGIVLSFCDGGVRATSRCRLPLGFVATHAFFVIVVYNFGRFRLGMMPVWMLFAAHGLSWLIAAARSDSRTTRWQAACGWIVAITLSAVAFMPPPGYERADFPYLQDLTRKQLRQREQDLNEATSLRAYLAQQAGDATAHQTIAPVLLRLGLKQEAIEHFEHAIRLRPADASLRVAFAVALEDILLDDRRAIEQLDAAVQLDPQMIVARSRLALMFIRQKRFNEAQMQFTELVRLEPSSAEHHYNLANLLQADGQVAAAISELREAAARKPFFPEVDRLLQKIVKSRAQLFDNAMIEAAATTFQSLSSGYRQAQQNEAAETCEILANALNHRLRQ